jgi:hypothetical protein
MMFNSAGTYRPKEENNFTQQNKDLLAQRILSKFPDMAPHLESQGINTNQAMPQ